MNESFNFNTMPWKNSGVVEENERPVRQWLCVHLSDRWVQDRGRVTQGSALRPLLFAMVMQQFDRWAEPRGESRKQVEKPWRAGGFIWEEVKVMGSSTRGWASKLWTMVQAGWDRWRCVWAVGCERRDKNSSEICYDVCLHLTELEMKILRSSLVVSSNLFLFVFEFFF